jgi:hypothetical protein
MSFTHVLDYYPHAFRFFIYFRYRLDFFATKLSVLPTVHIHNGLATGGLGNSSATKKTKKQEESGRNSNYSCSFEFGCEDFQPSVSDSKGSILIDKSQKSVVKWYQTVEMNCRKQGGYLTFWPFQFPLSYGGNFVFMLQTN